MGLSPGTIFVQRNVGNQASHTDMNCMSCLEYAVSALKVGAPMGAVSPLTCSTRVAAPDIPHSDDSDQMQRNAP